MNFAHWRSGRLSSKIALIVCLICGCQGQKPKELDPEARHLRMAAFLCREYYAATGTRPAKIDEVKEWAIEEGKATEDDFLSTRDKKPYEIMFFQLGNQLMVYEQTGVDGKHFLFHIGDVSEVTKQGLEARIGYMKSSRIMKKESPKKGGETESSAR